MTDNKDAHEKGEPLHPLSMPLEKGQEILSADAVKSADARPDSASAKPADAPSPAPKKSDWGRMALIVAAMAAFPFIFNAGTELYMLGRVALSTALGMDGGRSDMHPAEMPGMHTDRESKMLESLSTIIENQKKLMEEGGKVVIIRPEFPGASSFDGEKARVYQLSGIDMDDPMAGSDKISRIKSAEIILSLIESFDRIALGAAQNGTSDFHVKNAVEGKKQALARLQELK